MTLPEVPTLSEAQAVTEKFLHDFAEFQDMPERFRHAVEEGLHLLPIPWLKHKAQQLWDHLKELFSKLIDVLHEVVKFIEAPFVLIGKGLDWLEIKGKISEASANSDPNNLQAGRTENWDSKGAGAYRATAGNQSATASKTADIAETTALTLFSAGTAGVAFYGGLGYVLVSGVAELTTEAEGAASGVGTLPSLGAAIVTVLKSSAFVKALLTGIIALAGAEATQFATLKAKLEDGRFPHGLWPDPGQHAYAF